MAKTSYHHLLDVPTIPYDKKVYEGISPYIEANFGADKHQDIIKEAVKILDNPLLKIKDLDTKAFKQALEKLLPEVKAALHIDNTHSLKKNITVNIRREGLIDRLLIHQINVYRANMSGLLTEVLQEGAKKDYIDMDKKYELIVKDVPQTQNNIIAKIFVFMILEEELKKEETLKKEKK